MDKRARKENKMMKYKIYKIINDERVIYVGITTMSLKERKWKGYTFNKELNDVYKKSHFELIEETNDKGRENYWIDFYLRQGLNLLNKKRGNTNLTDLEIKILWYNKNLTSKKESDRIRYEKNKETIKQRSLDYYYKNKKS
jgi:hypothetical protein